MTNVSGSVRVDLLGGTLDLRPVNVILKNVVTINLATSLKAEVSIEKTNNEEVVINSIDYDQVAQFASKDFTAENLASDFFGPLKFMCIILDYFGATSGIKLTLQSGSPAGAGLGGSSAMGVTLYKALCEFTGKDFDPLKAIKVVNTIEGKILDCGPAGYQDYYPAMYGGVLALVPELDEVNVEQLFNDKLKDALERRITLVYSGQTRLSGINNWEVYKGYFDRNQTIRDGMQRIADLSHEAHEAIKKNEFDLLCDLIIKEGQTRKELFPGIVSPSMEKLLNDINKEKPEIGLKVCGAGGGGCFLIIHPEEDKDFVAEKIKSHAMEKLEFLIDQPL